jgi:hypothetical protein
MDMLIVSDVLVQEFRGQCAASTARAVYGT